jgi:hypothetical protein
MNCKRCEQPVKYITSHDGMNLFICDVDPIVIVNETGRPVEGYPLHVCREEGADAGIEID